LNSKGITSTLFYEAYGLPYRRRGREQRALGFKRMGGRRKMGARLQLKYARVGIAKV
jgi:hypothetical protein